MEVIDGTYSPLRVAHSSELKRGADGATAQHQVERGELAVVAIEDEEGADGRDCCPSVNGARIDDLDGHRGDQADHAARDAEQEGGLMRGFSATVTRPR